MAKQMTGAEMVVEALKDQGVEMRVRLSRRRRAADLRRAVRPEQGPPHSRPPRTGRGARGRRLCALDRQGRRAARHLGPRRDQRDHRPHRRADGFHSARLHHRSGADASHRLRRVPGMRHDRHHPQLHQAQLSRPPASRTCRASCTRRSTSPRTAGPGPVVIDIPKDVQFASGTYTFPRNIQHKTYQPQAQGRHRQDQARHRDDGEGEEADLLYRRRRHQFRPARLDAAARTRARSPAFPITSTLMGLGAYPASDKQWLGMLGMHGSFEANNAMHDCDLMICVGARFDDRITGRLDAFSPHSRRRSISTSTRPRSTRTSRSISASSAIARMCSRTWCGCGARTRIRPTPPRSPNGGRQIDHWRARKSFGFRNSHPGHQAAIRGAAALRADQGARRLHHDRSRPASDVGGAAFPLRGAEPLDDLGRPRHDGLRPAGGDRRADRASEVAGDRHRRRSLDPDEHPGDVDGDRSIACR